MAWYEIPGDFRNYVEGALPAQAGVVFKRYLELRRRHDETTASGMAYDETYFGLESRMGMDRLQSMLARNRAVWLARHGGVGVGQRTKVMQGDEQGEREINSNVNS